GAAAYRCAVAACDDAMRTGTAAVIGLRLGATLSEHGPVVRGVCEVAADRLTRIDEVYDIRRANGELLGVDRGGPRRLTGGELASMNFWVFPVSIFERLEGRFVEFLRRRGGDGTSELPLPEAVNELLQARAVAVRPIEVPGPWFGLTHVDDRPTVSAGLRALADARDYPHPLWLR